MDREQIISAMYDNVNMVGCCKEWENYKTFRQFCLETMGNKNTLRRARSSEPYGPDNYNWQYSLTEDERQKTYKLSLREYSREKTLWSVRPCNECSFDNKSSKQSKCIHCPRYLAWHKIAWKRINRAYKKIKNTKEPTEKWVYHAPYLIREGIVK